jgi:hypothetical protein
MGGGNQGWILAPIAVEGRGWNAAARTDVHAKPSCLT